MTGENKPTTEWTASQLSAEELAVRTVALLKERGKTVATAESCTGGLVAAALTDVPGSSAVIGTGVVAYSWDCKQQLLDVDAAVLEQYGAVSEPVAQQMAQGVRRRAGADLGVAVTGEAGPVAGEDQPVGTVFIALADSRRTWVKELHLDGEDRDRSAIRRLAAAHLLELTMRYLEAYPTVMAGGISHRVLAQQRVIPKGDKSGGHAWLRLVLPHRGDSPRRLVLKIAAWILTAAVLLCSLWLGYQYLVAPDTNRDLQASLGELYRDETSDLSDTETDDSGEYPKGMMTAFRGLYDRNPDVVGWVRIPGTAVDYPVMCYADGLYENHSFDGQYSLYGQPHFGSDTTLAGFEDSAVALINGRNTGNGQMFSSLLNYRRLAYLKENAIIQLDTLYHSATYEIFAVMVADESRPDEWAYARYTFASDQDFEEYSRSLQAHSLYRTDATVTAEDSLLLLSTDARQEYGFSGARLVIAARRQTQRDAVTTYHINNQVVMPQALTSSSDDSSHVTSTTVDVTDSAGHPLATDTDSSDTGNGLATTPGGAGTSYPNGGSGITTGSAAEGDGDNLPGTTMGPLITTQDVSGGSPATPSITLQSAISQSATKRPGTNRTTGRTNVTKTTNGQADATNNHRTTTGQKDQIGLPSGGTKTAAGGSTTGSVVATKRTTTTSTKTTRTAVATGDSNPVASTSSFGGTNADPLATETGASPTATSPDNSDGTDAPFGTTTSASRPAAGTEPTQVSTTATSPAGNTSPGDMPGDTTRSDTNKTEIDDHANTGN